MEIVFTGPARRAWRRKEGIIALAYPEIWAHLESIRKNQTLPESRGIDYVVIERLDAIVALFHRVEGPRMIIRLIEGV